LLETEHADLRADIDAAVAALAELRTAAERAPHANAAATLKWGAQRYTERAERLCARLARHLGDEEDLVVPLLLEHGDL
jgi:hypothetical protein